MGPRRQQRREVRFRVQEGGRTGNGNFQEVNSYTLTVYSLPGWNIAVLSSGFRNGDRSRTRRIHANSSQPSIWYYLQFMSTVLSTKQELERNPNLLNLQGKRKMVEKIG